MKVLVTLIVSDYIKCGGRKMKDLVERIAKMLVDHPDQVEVRETRGDKTVVLELKVAKEDVGKIIGKKGAHAQAIRTLLAAASGKDNLKYTLEIID